MGAGAININPLDSRYREKIVPLVSYFSDFALVKQKAMIETLYFIRITELLGGRTNRDPINKNLLIRLQNFNEHDYTRIQQLEAECKHDIKAVELWLREVIVQTSSHSKKERELIHIGLTSQDIVSSSYAVSINKYLDDQLREQLKQVIYKLEAFAKDNMESVFIARTHGQPAIPTSMGREMMVYCHRLYEAIMPIRELRMSAKFGGAIGNLAAHQFIEFDERTWKLVIESLFNSDELANTPITTGTTQVDNYRSLCHMLDHLRAYANILIDLCRDMWHYISLGYFNIKVDANHVGSSTMPQKINPIQFENAEGNLEIFVMWCSFLTDKLSKSRLQRDLTDSTVIRNIGSVFGYLHLALDSLEKGLGSLSIDKSILKKELENNFQVLGEAVQSMLRKEGHTSAYMAVKEHFIGQSMDKQKYVDAIKRLEIEDEELEYKLQCLEPQDYCYNTI